MGMLSHPDSQPFPQSASVLSSSACMCSGGGGGGRGQRGLWKAECHEMHALKTELRVRTFQPFTQQGGTITPLQGQAHKEKGSGSECRSSMSQYKAKEELDCRPHKGKNKGKSCSPLYSWDCHACPGEGPPKNVCHMLTKRSLTQYRMVHIKQKCLLWYKTV